jgi:ATP-dependent Zn protease
LQAFSLLVSSFALFAQDAATPPPSRLYTAVITWIPVIALFLVWYLFMRRGFGKGGYREYLRTSKERLERIEAHLADIAESLRKIAKAAERNS